MRQFFDIYGDAEFPKIILKNIEEENIALIQEGDITGFTPTLQFTGTTTISFTIEDSVEEPQIEYYDDIMLNNRIYVDGLDKERMFVIKECEEHTDNKTKTKTVNAIALEADMTNPITLLAGTYTFFDPLKPQESLMHLITKQNAEWGIGEIDTELAIMKFKFEEITMPTYQFLMTNVSEAYACVFSYDEIKKKINATTNGKAAKNKNIVLMYEDIINDVTKTPISEKFATAMETVGSGGLSVATVNPLGTNTIYNFNGVKDRMSVALRNAVTIWDTKVKTNQKPYADKLTILNDKNAEMQTLKTQQVNIQAIRDAKKEAMSVYVETGNTDNDDYRKLVDEYNKAIRDDVAKQVEIDTKKAEIDIVFAELKAINESLSLANNFTPQQIVLLSRYIYSTKVTDENYIQTDKMTNKEIQDMAQKLYDKYTLVLEKHCKELVSVTVSMNNFMRCLERREYTTSLELGDVITIQMMDDTYADLTVLEATWNYDDIETMSMTFADGLRLVGYKYENADNAIRQSVIDATVKGELVGWTEASKNNGVMNDMQNGGLDANLIAIKSNDKEEIKFDNTGLMARSYDKDLNTYSKEQLWLVHNQILLTDDSWETVKCAIGKLLFADGTTWGYGISAQIILGKILCGQRCIIQSGNTYVTIDEFGIRVENGAIEIKDKNGKAFIDGEKITLGDGKVGMTTYDNKLPDVPDLRIWAGSKDYDSRDTALFRVYDDGKVVMMNAEVHGDVITPDGGICNHGSGNDALFYGGTDESNRNNAKFQVSHNGKLKAQDADIKGTVACSKLLLNGQDVLTNNASQIDSKYIANLEVGSIKADTARIDTMWSKNLFVDKLESGFTKLLYDPKDTTTTTVNSNRIVGERQDWVTYQVDSLQWQYYQVDGDKGVKKDVYYVYLVGDYHLDWFTFSSMYERAIEWKPKTSYPKHQIVYSGSEYKYVAIDNMPNTITTWEAMDGSIALAVTENTFKVKIKKILQETVKSYKGFEELELSSGETTVMPVEVNGSGTEYGSKKGQSVSFKDDVGQTQIQYLQNNSSKLGKRMNMLTGNYEYIDPKTGEWKVEIFGYGGGGGNIVAHKDKTSLTESDRTGTNCLHVGYSSTGSKIVGETSTIYTSGLTILGWEEVTKSQPIDPTGLLYKLGNEYDSKTGGWSQHDIPPVGSGTTKSIVKQSSALKLYGKCIANTSVYPSFITVNKINTVGAKGIRIKLNCDKGYITSSAIVVSFGGEPSTNIVWGRPQVGDFELSWNNIPQGEYKIAVILQVNELSTYEITAHIYELELLY